MRRNLISIFFSTFILASSALALSVEEAYQAIPHRRMEYSAEKSTQPASTKSELAKLFKLSDQALVGRVETMNELQKGHAEAFDGYREKTDAIIAGLNEITDSEGAQLAGLLKDAIISQREFFSRWKDAVIAGKTIGNLGSDSSVRLASSKLQQLYGVLMQKYPKEHPNNIDAFYQHLCALDFL